MKRTDIYQTVTNTIIEALENGLSGEFELPWHRVSSIPQNARTGKLYRGVNVPLLWVHQLVETRASGIWATYKQWQEIGAQVRKGEKGAQIVFWKSFEVEPKDDNDEPETRMFARYSTVFNADQVEGYDIMEGFVPSDIEAIGAADALIDATGADIRHEGNSAYYSPIGDYIALPSPDLFKETKGSSATENYFSTLYHELTHWSGAEHRLNRFTKSNSDRAAYAFEELVAELGAAFLCASTGVASTVREDHTQYIQKWLEALKNDKKFVFSAASQAQKAVDYLFSF